MLYIKGIDVSNNKGSVDFGQVASYGVEYVYMKATEGESFQDGCMDSFYNDCKNNRLKVGPYHFLVETSAPEAQAQNFYETIRAYEWDLVPMMDIETNFENLDDYTERFITSFKQLCPLELGIYTYTGFIPNLSDAESTIKNMKFWEANYNNDPWNLEGTFFTNRIGHQYTENGSISGVSGNCDVDSFTEDALLDNSTIPGTWIIKDDKWWYKHDDGSYTTNGWEKINGLWYYFDSQGWMVYDWKKDGNNWYYLGNSNDGTMKSGWVLTDGKWYYFGDANDGAMKSGWVLIDGKWYYFGDANDGDMKTGWQKINEKLYFFNSSGAMQTGWQKINEKWYFFNSSGAMQTGWQKINEKWYFLNSSGAMQTGWINDNGKDYCFYSSGEMICNCDINGYRFASDGGATKLS